MSLSLNINVDDRALNETFRGILRIGGRDLNRMVAGRGEQLTRDYLRHRAATEHKTARRLNAQPTGHLGRAAESVTSEADDEAARISITSPGISRVAGPVTIRPRKAKHLTIPIHSLAYGKTVSEVRRLTGQKLFRPGPKNNKKRILAITRDKQLIPLFALAEQVTQKQDRTLLPRDEAYTQAARAGIRDYVQALIRRQGAATT